MSVEPWFINNYIYFGRRTADYKGRASSSIVNYIKRLDKNSDFVNTSSDINTGRRSLNRPSSKFLLFISNTLVPKISNMVNNINQNISPYIFYKTQSGLSTAFSNEFEGIYELIGSNNTIINQVDNRNVNNRTNCILFNDITTNNNNTFQ